VWRSKDCKARGVGSFPGAVGVVLALGRHICIQRLHSLCKPSPRNKSGTEMGACRWEPAGENLALPLKTWSPGIYPVKPKKIPAGIAAVLFKRRHRINIRAASKQSLRPVLQPGSRHFAPSTFLGSSRTACRRRSACGTPDPRPLCRRWEREPGQPDSRSCRFCSVPNPRSQQR